MGATVTTGKAVMGFKAKDKVFYVLFEETYEKNCSPHTPRWNCIAIGDYMQVMKRVFSHASAAEGGSLINRSNDLTPEMYIRGWSLAFNKVITFEDREIKFKILPRDRWYNGIESEQAGQVFTALNVINRLDIWEQLIRDTDDEVKLSVYDNMDIITALFGVDGVAAPWRILEPFGVKYGNHDTSLLPPKKCGGKLPKSMTPVIKVVGLNGVYFAELRSDGNYYGMKPDYSLMSDFVKNQALDAEMMSHGLGVKNIQSFRETIDQLPIANDDYDVYVSKSEIQNHVYLHRNFERDFGVKLEDIVELITFENSSLDDAMKKHYSFTSAFVFVPKQKAKLAA